MTTSDLKSGLRRALMTLEKSLHSNAGSPLSLTDSPGTPEERMAARLISRLGLVPRIDVAKIASSLAILAEKSFPYQIDGVSLDLKVIGKRPKIWVSRDNGHVRRRFTLAHEIGHVLIPWHTGAIIDDLDEPRSRGRGQYRQMEAEANRFAAELLMPTTWVKDLARRSEHCADLMHTIVKVADVSFPAAMFKTEKFGPPGFVFAEVQEGVVVRAGRTKGTWSLPPTEGVLLAQIEMPVALPARTIVADTRTYVWWQMREEVDAPLEEVPEWRETLERILTDLPVQQRHITRQRINAIVGYAIGQEPKGAPVERIYKFALESTQNRSDRDRLVAAVVKHPDFKRYLYARALDRSRAVPAPLAS